MAPETASIREIELQVREEFKGTLYACSSLTHMPGGSANYIFRGELERPLEDGTSEVVVKHGEAFAASNPALKLSINRCTLEKECLRLAQDMPGVTSSSYDVRAPRLFRFNPASSTQVLEYLPNSINLKLYALKHFSPSTPASMRPRVIEVGKGLGTWLRSFHGWAASPAQQEQLCTLALMNTEMHMIKLNYAYKLLLSRAEAHPDLLGDAKPVLEEVIAMVMAEVEDGSRLQVIHGDFWTGNILLPDEALQPSKQTPLLVIDWEMLQLWLPQLDLGQMIAELYELYLYRRIEAGLWLIEGFVAGYGGADDDFAFRTALHIGTHLVGFGSMVPGWGTAEQALEVLAVGRDIILRAWAKDRAWFERHDLRSIFNAE